MTNPNSLNPDFTMYETVANSDTLHLLSICNHTDTTFAHFDAYKLPRKKPYHSMSWQTRWNPLQALRSMENTDSIRELKATKGKIVILDSEEDDDYLYDWTADEATIPKGADTYEALEIVGETTDLVRIDTSKAAIVWARSYPENHRHHLGVITEQKINTNWLKILMGMSAEPETRRVIDRNIGRIATALETFVKLPFGVPSLEGGFSRES